VAEAFKSLSLSPNLVKLIRSENLRRLCINRDIMSLDIIHRPVLDNLILYYLCAESTAKRQLQTQHNLNAGIYIIE
jgi:hypothetical protein